MNDKLTEESGARNTLEPLSIGTLHELRNLQYILMALPTAHNLTFTGDGEIYLLDLTANIVYMVRPADVVSLLVALNDGSLAKLKRKLFKKEQ